jgi:polar amino acid transport system substrate-binding protein
MTGPSPWSNRSRSASRHVSASLGSRRRLLVAGSLLAVVGLALLAVGCGSSTTSSSTSPTASASTTTVAGVTITSDPALYAMLPSSIKSAGEIRVASDIPYPPWEYYVSAGSSQVTGFDYDLSQALGAKIGIKAAFIQTPFDSIILSVQGGKRDMIMSDMYDNAEREKVLTFVDYAYDGTSILVPKGNPSGVTNLDSLAGKTVACESGTTQQKLLQTLNTQFKSSGKPQMNILALPNQPAALLAVKSGRAVGDLTDHSTAEYIAKTTNNGNTYEVVADPSAPNGYEPQVVGVGILKSNTQLIDTVQKALQALINDGAYKTIIDKYGLLPVTSAQINQGPGYSASATASPSP